MSTTISIEPDRLVVRLTGLDRFLTLRGRIEVPLRDVRGATADPGIVDEPKGRRWPGTHIPGVVVGGTFVHDGERTFWNVRDRNRAVVVQLEHHRYRRLVLDVDDPRSAVRAIQQALPTTQA